MSRLELAAVDMPMGGIELEGKIVPSMAVFVIIEDLLIRGENLCFIRQSS